MITDKYKRLKLRILLISAAFLTTHLCFWLLPEVFETWNARAVDRLFLLRSQFDSFRPHYDDTIVLVDLNLSSIRQLNNFYLDRSYHAQVIRNLKQMDVAAQLYDIIFVAKSPDERADEELMDATRAADNVYFGMAFESLGKTPPARDAPASSDDEEYMNRTKWKIKLKGHSSSLYSGDHPMITFFDLAAVSRGTGFINMESDQDGVFRRLPLLVRYGDEFYPSFALKAACDYLQVDPGRVIVEPGRAVALKGAKRPGEKANHDITIPIDSHGRMIINLVGPWGAMKHYGFADIFTASDDQDKMDIWKQEMAGKIVIISESLAGSSDAGPVPTDTNFPLSGLHANAVNTILTESFLREVPGYQTLWLELLLLFLTLVLSYQFSPWAFFFGTCTIAAGYILTVASLFFCIGIVLPLVRPLVMVTLAFISIQVVRTVESARLQAEAEKAKEVAERDLEIGRKIQASFLPESLPTSPDWEIVAHFQPARQVAGDFYDAFEMEGGKKVGFVIADVCDKGVGAALFMSLFRSLIRAFATQEFLDHPADQPTPFCEGAGTLEAALRLSNNYIARTHGNANMFATVFFGVLDPQTGTLNYVNAGHEPPFVISRNGVRDRLTPTGPAVGIMPDLDYTAKQCQLGPGEIVLAYTDGVTDSQNLAGEFLGKEGLMKLCLQSHDSVEALMDSVLSGVYAYTASLNQFDDLTMIAVMWKRDLQCKIP